MRFRALCSHWHLQRSSCEDQKTQSLWALNRKSHKHMCVSWGLWEGNESHSDFLWSWLSPRRLSVCSCDVVLLSDLRASADSSCLSVTAVTAALCCLKCIKPSVTIADWLMIIGPVAFRPSWRHRRPRRTSRKPQRCCEQPRRPSRWLSRDFWRRTTGSLIQPGRRCWTTPPRGWAGGSGGEALCEGPLLMVTRYHLVQVMEAEHGKTRSELLHKETAAKYTAAIGSMKQLEKKLKRTINKSKWGHCEGGWEQLWRGSPAQCGFIYYIWNEFFQNKVDRFRKVLLYEMVYQPRIRVPFLITSRFLFCICWTFFSLGGDHLEPVLGTSGDVTCLKPRN